ncbi:DUF397 domain-containing protein [Streptomyces sp. NPDC059578]|uniref:DUF397 domain-containing protein n=1 Tax=Streptomyces sp. NPDC059578 TaxID=3346874 RepID=UPI0036BCD757
MHAVRHTPREELLSWRRSSHSGSSGYECLEVADGVPSGVPIRDSKRPHGPVLLVRNAAWTAFLGAVRTGDPLSS